MAYKSSQLDNLIALRLLTMLCTPFKEFPAYKAGIIDEKGKYILPSYKRTSQQKKSLTYLDKLIINAKKMINKLPGGENKIKNIVSAMILIKESVDNNAPECMINEQSLQQILQHISTEQHQRMIDIWADYIKSKNIEEDVTSSAIAGGSGPTNTTSGVAFPSFPLGIPISKRRKGILS